MARRRRPRQPQDFVVNVGDRVFFESDSTELTAQARATLDKQAQWLQRYNRYAFTIEGHADERGTREYNIALGARRAQAVRDYLAVARHRSSRMRTISYGKERPVAVCNDISCWSQNRRAVTVLNASSKRTVRSRPSRRPAGAGFALWTRRSHNLDAAVPRLGQVISLSPANDSDSARSLRRAAFALPLHARRWHLAQPGVGADAKACGARRASNLQEDVAWRLLGRIFGGSERRRGPRDGERRRRRRALDASRRCRHPN